MSLQHGKKNSTSTGARLKRSTEKLYLWTIWKNSHFIMLIQSKHIRWESHNSQPWLKLNFNWLTSIQNLTILCGKILILQFLKLLKMLIGQQKESSLQLRWWATVELAGLLARLLHYKHSLWQKTKPLIYQNNNWLTAASHMATLAVVMETTLRP